MTAATRPGTATRPESRRSEQKTGKMKTAEQSSKTPAPQRMQDWWRANHFSNNPPPAAAARADELLERFYDAHRELAAVTDALWACQQEVMSAHLASVARGED